MNSNKDNKPNNNQVEESITSSHLGSFFPPTDLVLHFSALIAKYGIKDISGCEYFARETEKVK